MLSLGRIINALGIGVNFKGDRIDAFREGATGAYQLMANERKLLFDKLKEMGLGEEEIYQVCDQKAGSTQKKLESKEGGKDTGQEAGGSSQEAGQAGAEGEISPDPK